MPGQLWRLVSSGQDTDLDRVVGEDAVTAPGSGAVDAGEFVSVPAVAVLEVVDPSVGPGPPFDFGAEGSSMFKCAAGRAGAEARNHGVSMTGYIWDLSGTDRQCASYAPGHLIHWIHFKLSMREPSVVIPVTASVDDDGLVHIEGDGLSLVRWNHRPALVRAALERFGGRADWKPRWYLLAVPERQPCPGGGRKPPMGDAGRPPLGVRSPMTVWPWRSASFGAERCALALTACQLN
jgi:hypothetical protein